MKTVLVGLAVLLASAGLAPARPVQEDAVVQIKGKAFDPARLEIVVGETVTWKNYDLTDHTVTASNRPALPDQQSRQLFDSGVLKPGDVFSYTFTRPGTFEYACSIHKTMTGVVVVAPIR
jgi:plastocyanin